MGLLEKGRTGIAATIRGSSEEATAPQRHLGKRGSGAQSAFTGGNFSPNKSPACLFLLLCSIYTTMCGRKVTVALLKGPTSPHIPLKATDAHRTSTFTALVTWAAIGSSATHSLVLGAGRSCLHLQWTRPVAQCLQRMQMISRRAQHYT